MSLMEHLQQLPEFRAARGQRYPLWLVVFLVILGAMAGYWGYRPLAEFTQTHGDEIRCQLQLSPDAPLPSYSTFRRVMHQLDYEQLAMVFTHWAQTHSPPGTGEWLASDGKAIKGTVSHCDQAQQNFVSCVSMFSHTSGLVQAVMPMQNKHQSEPEVVRSLLQAVAMSGVGMTLDALHCQKKH